MNLVIIPNDKENIKNLDDCYILLGIKGYSVNLISVDINELKEIPFPKDKMFIALNKNFTNSELESLEKLIIMLDEMGVAGLFYYDVAVVNIVNRLKLKIKLIWSAEHLTTNYFTVNYWHKHNVWGAFLSNEITMEEIEEIADNTSSALFVQLFGYIPMYVSRRHAIKNYLKYFNLSPKGNEYNLYKEGKTYQIVDNEEGTMIYSPFILNGLKESIQLKDKIPFIVINGYRLDNDQLSEVITYFKRVKSNNIEKLNTTLQSHFTNLASGFLHEETIYRVKKNEK